jgi:hypothetical protein
VFENILLRGIFGPQKAVVRGEWRKMHNEELQYLALLVKNNKMTKQRRMRWAEHTALTGEDKRIQNFVKKTGRKEKTKKNLDINETILLKWGLKTVRWYNMDWIVLIQDRDQWRAVVNTAMNVEYEILTTVTKN